MGAEQVSTNGDKPPRTPTRRPPGPGEALLTEVGTLPAGLSTDTLRELNTLVASEEAHDLVAAAKEHVRRGGRKWLLTGAEVLARPTPEWLVEGLFPSYGIGHLVGPTKAFKSFLAIDLALSITNGLDDWFGHKVKRSGSVVYLALEGGFDFGKRLKAWLADHPGTSIDGFLASIEQPVSLGNPYSVAPLKREIAADVNDLALVVVDTQGLATPGTDENSANAMNEMLAGVKTWATEAGAFVLLVQHTGWDKSRERGSSAQRQADDATLLVERDDERDYSGNLVIEKVKAAEDGQRYVFEMARSDESLVVRTADSIADALSIAGRKIERLERRVMDYVASHPHCTRTAVADALGGRKADVVTTVRDLLDVGDLVLDTKKKLVVGTKSGTA